LSLSHSQDLGVPAAIRDGDSILQPRQDFKRYLDLELRTPKLDKIQDYLWLAGLPRFARSLHRQKLLGRNILITENVNEHLVWVEDRFFVKPLPLFLLDFDLWQEHMCADMELHKSACGLILSYTWLVCHRSDFRIAKDLGLLPEPIDWHTWIEFAKEFLKNIDPNSLQGVGDRYKYGELRLPRLNTIYRMRSASPRQFVFGFMSSSTWYKSFFARNFAWLLAVFVYLSVILSALQVGLTTTTLQASMGYQSAAYGFSVASIVAVLFSVVVIFLVWQFLFIYHFTSAWLFNQQMARKRAKLQEV
jgi:hypothetical protein